MSAVRDKRIPDTLPEIEARIAEVENEIAVMRGKISAVKAKRLATGEWADPVWFAKINGALKSYGVLHQRLLRQAAALRRADREARAMTVDSAFVKAARRELPPATFASIMAQAVLDVPVPTD